jgi:hypothetical protein
MINWKGICVFAVILLAGCGNDRDTSEEPRLSGESLSRFATLASDCITVEYPNKLSQGITPGLLRLLRLAFGGAWSLDAGQVAQGLSRPAWARRNLRGGVHVTGPREHCG